MADQKVERDLPVELQIFFISQHGFWMKFCDQNVKTDIFDQTLEICKSASIL